MHAKSSGRELLCIRKQIKYKFSSFIQSWDNVRESKNRFFFYIFSVWSEECHLKATWMNIRMIYRCFANLENSIARDCVQSSTLEACFSSLSQPIDFYFVTSVVPELCQYLNQVFLSRLEKVSYKIWYVVFNRPLFC